MRARDFAAVVDVDSKPGPGPVRSDPNLVHGSKACVFDAVRDELRCEQPRVVQQDGRQPEIGKGLPDLRHRLRSCRHADVQKLAPS